MKQTTLPFNPEEIKPSKPKLDDKGYPTEASPEQMAVLHDKVMTNRYISGANKFGEYPDPKTKMQLRREAYQQKIKDNQEKKKIAQQTIKPEPRKYTQGKERDHFKYFSKYKEMLEPTKEEIERAKEPSMWDTIYDGMSPQEKGSWNTEQRKKGFNGKTADPIGSRAVSGRPFPPDTFTLSTDQGTNQNLNAPIPKEVNQIMNNEIENIRQMRMDAERLRGIPKRRLEIKKKELAGLHEDFTREKLQIAAILREEDDKV
jgi:hypothetical protein